MKFAFSYAPKEKGGKEIIMATERSPPPCYRVARGVDSHIVASLPRASSAAFDEDAGLIVASAAFDGNDAEDFTPPPLSPSFRTIGDDSAKRATLLSSFLSDLLVRAPETTINRARSPSPEEAAPPPGATASTAASTTTITADATAERTALCKRLCLDPHRVSLLRSDASGQGQPRWWALQRPHPNYRCVLGATFGAAQTLHLVLPHLDLSVKALVSRARAGGAQDRPWWCVRSEGMATSASVVEGGAQGSIATHDGMVRARFLAYQLLHALAFAHGAGLAHGAIDPRAALLTDDLWLQLDWPRRPSNARAGIVASASAASSGRTAFALSPSASLSLPRTVESYDPRPLTLRWAVGDVGNLDYLLALNAAVGRQFASTNNHPVVPWVTDFSVRGGGWRDLSRGMFRLHKGDQQLEATFRHGSPPHHVPENLSELTFCIYMARRMPMATLRRVVRSNFEAKEYPGSMARLFAWTPDECIPEFYNDPTCFVSREPSVMSDVELPPWCDDPAAFVRYHRECLESEAVSQQLHHWIDLYFGYLLRGRAAVEAKNVTLPPPRSMTTLCKPAEFVRLFNRPHPPRRPRRVVGAETAPTAPRAATSFSSSNVEEERSNAVDELSGLADLETVHAFALEHHHIVLPRYNNKKNHTNNDDDNAATTSAETVETTAGASDLFAAGCVIAELFLCRPLFGCGCGDGDAATSTSAHVKASLQRLPPVVAAAIAALVSPNPPSAELLLRQLRCDGAVPTTATQADRRFRGLFPPWFVLLHAFAAGVCDRSRTPEAAVVHALEHADAILALPNEALAISLPLLLRLIDSAVPLALKLIVPIATRLGSGIARRVVLPHLLQLMEGVGSRGRGAAGGGGVEGGETSGGASEYWLLMRHMFSPSMQQRLVAVFGPETWLGEVLPVILDIVGEATAPEVVRASAATSLAQMAQKSNLGPALTVRYILHPLMQPILRLRPSAASPSCIVALVRLVIELPSEVLCHDIVPPLQGALAAAVELLCKPVSGTYATKRRADAEAACHLQLQLLGGMIPMLPTVTLIDQLLRGNVSLPLLLLRLGVPAQNGGDDGEFESSWESRLALVGMLVSVCQLVGPEVTDRYVLIHVRALFDILAEALVEPATGLLAGDGDDTYKAGTMLEQRCCATALALFRPLRDLLGVDYMRTSALSPRGSQLIQRATKREVSRGREPSSDYGVGSGGDGAAAAESSPGQGGALDAEDDAVAKSAANRTARVAKSAGRKLRRASTMMKGVMSRVSPNRPKSARVEASESGSPGGGGIDAAAATAAPRAVDAPMEALGGAAAHRLAEKRNLHLGGASGGSAYTPEKQGRASDDVHSHWVPQMRVDDALSFKAHVSPIVSLAGTEGPSRLLVTGSSDSTIRMWRLPEFVSGSRAASYSTPSGSEVRSHSALCLRTYNGHRRPAFAIHLIDDEHVVSCDGVLDLWHPETGARILQLGQGAPSAQTQDVSSLSGADMMLKRSNSGGGGSSSDGAKAASGGTSGGGDESGGGSAMAGPAVHAAMGMVGGDSVGQTSRSASESALRNGRFVALACVNSHTAMHAEWPQDGCNAGEPDSKLAPPVWAPYGLLAATAVAEVCTVDFRLRAGVARIGGGWRPAMPKDPRFGMLSCVVRDTFFFRRGASFPPHSPALDSFSTLTPPLTLSLQTASTCGSWIAVGSTSGCLGLMDPRMHGRLLHLWKPRPPAAMVKLFSLDPHKLCAVAAHGDVTVWSIKQSLDATERVDIDYGALGVGGTSLQRLHHYQSMPLPSMTVRLSLSLSLLFV